MEMDTAVNIGGDVEFILVAFKIAKKGPQELLVNRLAAWLTLANNASKKNASHVEVLIRDKKTRSWYRYSIMKQRGILRRSSEGEETITWTPGVVHKIESGENMLNRDYVFLVVPASGDDVASISRFLDSQIGAGFNREGYLLNFVTPFRFGVCATNPKKIAKGNKQCRWFCSELITSALQTFQDVKIEGLKKMIPCEQSPNDLYRFLKEKYKFIRFEDILKNDAAEET